MKKLSLSSLLNEAILKENGTYKKSWLIRDVQESPENWKMENDSPEEIQKFITFMKQHPADYVSFNPRDRGDKDYVILPGDYDQWRATQQQSTPQIQPQTQNTTQNDPTKEALLKEFGTQTLVLVAKKLQSGEVHPNHLQLAAEILMKINSIMVSGHA